MKIKYRVLLAFLIIILIPRSIFPWGRDGHKLISKKSIQILPEEMKEFKVWASFMEEHSTDADERRKTDSTEFPKHFIDIDHYEEFQLGRMIWNKDELIKKYGDSLVTKMGIVPWVMENTFNKLTKAFEEKNKDRIMYLIADLSHYVADSHQPFHTTINYNGQLTGQKGIHYRYESKMISKFLDEINDDFDTLEVRYVNNIKSLIHNFITNSNSLVELLLAGDKHALKYSGDYESDDYYNLLWFKTKYITMLQIDEAARTIASIVYTAWLNAGKPEFNEIN